MKLNPAAQPSRTIPIFSRMFHHKIRYQSFSRRLCFPRLPAHLSCQSEMAVRRFSTRSSRFRTDSGLEGQASKSLIDDEAELSDWVGGLSSSSYRFHFNSDSDEDRDNRNLGRNVRRGGDEGGGKRRRESSSDDYGLSRTGRKSRGRDSFVPVSGNLRAKGSVFGRERDQGTGGGLRPGVKGIGRQSRGRNSFASFSGNSREKGCILERGRDRQAGGLRRATKGARREFATSDDDDVEYSDGEEEKELSLRELMSEEESEEESDEDEDDRVLKMGNSFSRTGSEDGLPIFSRASSDRSGSDSYLTETRFQFFVA